MISQNDKFLNENFRKQMNKLLSFIGVIFTSGGILLNIFPINQFIFKIGEIIRGKHLNADKWLRYLNFIGFLLISCGLLVLIFQYVRRSREKIFLLLKKLFFNKLSFILIFCIIFFGARIPFYLGAWDGQDGNGTTLDIFINHPKTPKYFELGRINGKEIYACNDRASHPGTIYETIAYTGDIFKQIINFKGMSDFQLRYTSKAIFSLYQFLIFFLLIIILSLKNKGKDFDDGKLFLLLGIIVVSILPISLYSNYELQPDSSVGILMVGLPLIVFLLYHLNMFSTPILICLSFLTSVFLGFGKNEWSILYGLSIVLLFALLLFKKKVFKLDTNRKDFYLLTVCLLGCLIGNLISYWFDPINYMGGLNLLLGMGYHATLIKVDIFKQWLQMTIERFPFILPHLIMFGYLFIKIIKKHFQNEVATVFGFIFSSLLFFSFFFSAWGAFPRYFVPSFTAFVISCVMIYPSQISLWQKRILGIVLFVLLVQSAGYINTQAVKFQYNHEISVAEKVKSQNCEDGFIPLLMVEDAFNKKIDFITPTLGHDGAKDFAEKYGKKIKFK